VQAAEVLTTLKGLGVRAWAEGEKLVVEPGSRVPAALVPEIRRHKAEILVLLAGKAEGEHRQCRYRQVYPGPGPGEGELAEMERRVNREGSVLCWAEILDDFVAFHRDDVDPASLPPDFVPYSLEELTHLFREDGEPLSINALRLVHQAKKMGGRVTGDYSDQGDKTEGS
jgi:hypothetical protein